MNDATGAQPIPLLDPLSLAQLEEDLGADLVPEILTAFLDESERRIALLVDGAEAGDCRVVADQAHALKGSAGTFGAMAMLAVSQRLEMAGRDRDHDAIVSLLPELRRLFADSCDALRLEYPCLAGSGEDSRQPVAV